jgi:hypothetical protein
VEVEILSMRDVGHAPSAMGPVGREDGEMSLAASAGKSLELDEVRDGCHTSRTSREAVTWMVREQGSPEPCLKH